MKNYFLWLQLVGTLATDVANKEGKAPKELQYLNILTQAARAGTLTDADLTALHQKIQADKAAGLVPTDEDLLALEQRLLARSAEIQSS